MRENIDSTNLAADVYMSLASGCTSCEISTFNSAILNTSYATNFLIHVVMHSISQNSWMVFCPNYDSRVLVTHNLNIDHIKFTDNEATLFCLTTFRSWSTLHYKPGWLHIPQLLLTMFLLKFSEKELFPNITKGIFYCDNSHPLPCSISIQHENRFNLSNRPMTLVFSERNCANFRSKMDSENWARIHQDESRDSILLSLLPFHLIIILASLFSECPENVGITKGLTIRITTKHRLYK